MDSLELVQIRLVPDKKLYSDTPIRNAEDACKLLADEMKTLDRETVAVIAMNSQNQILSASFCSVGSLLESIVVPREVFKSGILQNAASFILLHNHPSRPSLQSEQYHLKNGSVYQNKVHPSEEDIDVTKRMIACGELLGIQMLDHVIVAGYTGEFFSFSESGMMSQNELDRFLAARNVAMPMEKENQKMKGSEQHRKR